MVSTKSSVAPELRSDDELTITEEAIADQMAERSGGGVGAVWGRCL